MASTVMATSLAETSSYNSRRVVLQVTGGTAQETTRQGIYTLTVPYRSLSQTLQRIHRQGGIVNGVMMSNGNKTSTQSPSSKRASTDDSEEASTNDDAASKGKKGISKR
jgi:predicted dinucleotide-binding enzyme